MARRLFIGLVLIGFVVSIAVGIDTLLAGDAVVKGLLAENVLWAATQAHTEVLRLHSALIVLADREDAAAAEEVLFRLDILWSRVGVLENGEIGRFLAASSLDGRIEALNGTLGALDTLAPALGAPADAGFRDAVQAALAVVSEEVAPSHAWTLEVLHADRERSLALIDDRRETVFWLIAAFGGLVLVGVAFGGLLLREIGRANRKSAEATAALATAAAAERRLVDAIETIPEGFALYDALDRLAVCNERYRTIYANSAPAMRVGNTFEAIVRYGAERGQYVEAIGRVDEWVRERVERHRNPGAPIEQPLGNNRWVRIEERPTAEGGVVGVRVDITDIKRAQQLLERAEAITALGHFNLDTASGRIHWSAQLYRILGVDPASGPATTDRLLATFEPPEAARLDEMLTHVAGGGSAGGAVMETRKIDGKRRWLEITLESEPNAMGDLSGIFGTVQDVTRSYEAERRLEVAMADAEAANAAKSRFLSIMSHEIRTPMNGIAGALNLIDADQLDTAVGDLVEVARSSTDRLRTVLNDILDFTRIEGGQLALECDAFDAYAFAAEATAFWAGTAAAKGLALRRHIAPDVAPVLLGDVGRLRQIVDNLLSNAIKYTLEGTVTLNIHAAAADAAHDRQTLTIGVQDTGVGIAPEDRDRVFVDFTQLHARQGLAQGGSGLGLAICRRLVELMDGSIDFESEPGRGSTFRVKVPLALAPAGTTVGRRSPERGVTPVLPAGLRVLLAEDNPTNQLIARATLEKMGCTVDIAADGREAVMAATARPYDVVLMDVSMPEMDGLAATQAIRAALEPGPPILAFTAYAMTEDHNRFRQAGMDGVVAKPLSAGELARSISAVTDDRALVSGLSESSASQGTADVLVDLTVLRGLDDNLDDSTFVELCQRFERDVIRCTGMIRTAAVEGDHEGVERASHTLTSVAATLGAEALSKAARQINRTCRDAGALPEPDAVDTLDRLAGQTLACVRDCTTCGYAAACTTPHSEAEA